MAVATIYGILATINMASNAWRQPDGAGRKLEVIVVEALGVVTVLAFLTLARLIIMRWRKR